MCCKPRFEHWNDWSHFYLVAWKHKANFCQCPPQPSQGSGCLFSCLFLGCLGPLEKGISLYSLSSQKSHSPFLRGSDDIWIKRRLRIQVLQEGSQTGHLISTAYPLWNPAHSLGLLAPVFSYAEHSHLTMLLPNSIHPRGLEALKRVKVHKLQRIMPGMRRLWNKE